MPKKDVESAILGMLSTAGSETRPLRPAPAEDQDAADTDTAPLGGTDRAAPEAAMVREDPAEAAAVNAAQSTPEPEPVQPDQAAPPRSITPPPTRSSGAKAEAPRTLRLRPTAAAALREAWLEAKHEDVLLTAQDFASDLLEEMLKIRRRRTKAAS